MDLQHPLIWRQGVTTLLLPLILLSSALFTCTGCHTKTEDATELLSAERRRRDQQEASIKEELHLLAQVASMVEQHHAMTSFEGLLKRLNTNLLTLEFQRAMEPTLTLGCPVLAFGPLEDVVDQHGILIATFQNKFIDDPEFFLGVSVIYSLEAEPTLVNRLRGIDSMSHRMTQYAIVAKITALTRKEHENGSSPFFVLSGVCLDLVSLGSHARWNLLRFFER